MAPASTSGRCSPRQLQTSSSRQCSRSSRFADARRLGRQFQPHPDAALCTAAQLGVAMCPCAGAADARRYEVAVGHAAQAMTTSPELVIAPLQARLAALSAERRYEEAAQVRDRAMAFTNAVRRQRLTDRLREAGDVGLQLGDTTLHLQHGVLVGTAQEGQIEIGLPLPAPDVPPAPQMLPRHVVDEVLCLARCRTTRSSPHRCVVRRSLAMADRRGARGRRSGDAATRVSGRLIVGFDRCPGMIDAQHLGMTSAGHLRGEIVGLVQRAHRCDRRARAR